MEFSASDPDPQAAINPMKTLNAGRQAHGPSTLSGTAIGHRPRRHKGWQPGVSSTLHINGGPGSTDTREIERQGGHYQLGHLMEVEIPHQRAIPKLILCY